MSDEPKSLVIRTTSREIASVILIFAVVCALCFFFQDRTRLRRGMGNDGLFYTQVTQKLVKGRPLIGQSPFFYRPGVPWIVAQFSPDSPPATVEVFHRVNIAANLITVVLLSLWLSLFIKRVWVRVLMSFLFQAHWLGPIRFSFFYPVIVDVVPNVLVLAFLIILFGMQIPTFAKTALLSVITFAGVTMRENIIALPASLLVVDLNQLRLRDGWQAITQQVNKVLRIALVPLLAGLAGIAFTRRIAIGSGYPGYWATVMWFLENKPITSWMLAWFGMFGPLLALVLYDWKATLKFLSGKPVLWAFSAMIATLSFIGGTDTERFLGWMFPIVFVLIGMSIERCLPLLRSAWVLVPLVITQAFAMRLFWATPQYKIKGCTGEPTFTFLTILGKCVTVPQLFVDAAPEPLLQVIFLQWVFVVVGLIALLWFLDHKRKKNDPAPAGTG